ncbi:MAG: chromate efflux transporter [Verrucomicrobiota bacterium]
MKPEPIPAPDAGPVFPGFGEACRYWLKLGCISFGGPAGQIAIMHRSLVEDRRWISESHFLHALNFCTLLPGPEAQQLATYLGWRLHGWKGGVAAGAFFVLPSALLLLGLSWLYAAGSDQPWLAAVFYGLSPAVIALVFSALLRIARKALRTPALWIIAGSSFAAMISGWVPFTGILAAVAIIGWAGGRWFPGAFSSALRDCRQDGKAGDLSTLQLPPVPPATWRRAAGIIILCGSLWWLPVLAAGLWPGSGNAVFQQGIFFSKTALITFGGAYAVLPYVASQAVGHFGWLSQSQMMAGLALAETTPGPLIMVLQFVGFMAGWQNPGALSPLTAAVLGSIMTTWVTFLPCFLFVFLGAPHIERLHTRPRLSAVLSAITAAVTGIILNLAVWLTWHALWPHGWQPAQPLGGPDLFTALLSLAAFLTLHRTKTGVLPVIAACAVLGALWRLVIVAG